MPHCCNKKCMVSWTLRHGAPCLIHTGSSLNALWLVPLVPLLFAFVTPLPCSTCVDLVLFVLMRASVVTFPLLSMCSGRARNSSGGSTWWNGLRVVTGEPGVCCKGKSMVLLLVLLLLLSVDLVPRIRLLPMSVSTSRKSLLGHLRLSGLTGC